MMSLPICLPGPMLLLGGSLSLVPCSFHGVSIGRTPTPQNQKSRRYASYWNAFLAVVLSLRAKQLIFSLQHLCICLVDWLVACMLTFGQFLKILKLHWISTVISLNDESVCQICRPKMQFPESTVLVHLYTFYDLKNGSSSLNIGIRHTV